MVWLISVSATSSINMSYISITQVHGGKLKCKSSFFPFCQDLQLVFGFPVMSAPCPTSRSSQIPLAGAPTSKWSQKSVTHFTGALMDQMEESVCHALFVLPLCSAPLGCQGYHPACRLTAAYAPSYTEHERCDLILLTLKKALRLKVV